MFTIKLRSVLYIIIMFSINILPQIKVENIKQSTDQISFLLNLNSIPYSKIKNKKNIETVTFKNYINESDPGLNALPDRTIFIALPAFSKVKVTLTPTLVNKINGIPKKNPFVSLKNDSTINYNYNPTISTANNFQPLYKIMGYLWIRNYYCVEIKINQYRFNNTDIIEELKKASLQIIVQNPGNNKIQANYINDKYFDKTLSALILNYREAKPLNKQLYLKQNITENDSWIDFNSEYLKIGVAEDGVYRIRLYDLNNSGIVANSIDPTTYKLFCKGNEQPIYVYGENDGQFNSGDYIEFIGKKNWGANYKETSAPGESYKEYQDRYSDTTVYWLTWGGAKGKRIDTSRVLSTSNIDTLYYHYQNVHYEQNKYLDYSINSLITRQDPEWLQNETWIWGLQSVGAANRNFSVNNVYPGQSAFAYYKIQDYASDITANAHKVGLSINSDPTVYDSSFFNKYDQRVVNAKFSSDLLINGSNRLKTISFPTNASLNSIAYDWYEVDYPQYNIASGDSIIMNVSDDNYREWKTVKVSNINTNKLAIYRIGGISKSKKIVDYNLVNNDLYFDDSVVVKNKYFVFPEDKIQAPKIYYKKTFQDLSAPSNQADYILITAPEFLNKAGDYVKFVQQNYNVTTKVVNVNDIYDQYNYGFFAPEPIKIFLQAANLYWQSPKPSYLFIVGDANYDYYGNTHKYFGSPLVKNYVPSYGHPVSDNWFVDWDSTNALVQQMYVGRIPVNSLSEFDHYLNKHKKYLSDSFDAFNKTYLLISSGDIHNSSELQYLKSTNDFVANNIIQPAPVGGIVHHLYKTQNPITDFGPYTDKQVADFIGVGGLFISYIGHSGTQVWDNGINTIEQLKNNSGKGSLISDWGCSTGKFAEPDVKAFSELFINQPDGQAIAYTGNTSLGFTSTATIFPKLFYSELLNNNSESIGMTQSSAKNKLLETYGKSSVYRIFALCNALLGDPIIKLKIPPKPNLKISSADLATSTINIDDSQDSVKLKIYFYNLGKVDTTHFNISIIDNLDNRELFNKIISKGLPDYKDSLEFYLPVKKLAGDHKLKVQLDSGNSIDEISKGDNTFTFDIFVSNSSVRALVSSSTNLIANGNFVFINPIKRNNSDSINVQYADNQDFNNSQVIIKKLDTLATKVSLPGLTEGQRYWVRSKLNTTAQPYGSLFSFIYNSQNDAKILLSDSLSFSKSELNNVDFSDNKMHLLKSRKELKMQTAGYYDGTYAIITVNGINYVTSSNLAGHHILVFDEKTLKFEGETLLNYYGDSQNFESKYIAALDSIPDNKIIAIATNDDPRGGLTNSIKDRLKAIGSTKIDSVEFRSTWGIITKKNYIPGHVLEGYSSPFNGPVVLDTTITLEKSVGNFVTENIGPAAVWEKLNISSEIPLNSEIYLKTIGIKKDNTIDTLSSQLLGSNSIDLSNVDSKNYPDLKFDFVFTASDTNNLPSISSIKVYYTGVPELGTNYQLVSVDKDSVKVGGKIKLDFSVMNIGESAADTFNVKVDVVSKDNSKSEIFNKQENNLSAGGRKNYEINYNTGSSSGPKYFYIYLDTETKITELLKDNNFFSVPFIVEEDSNKPELKITFDNREIVDNDFVSSNPKIKLELDDPSLLPVTDTSAISFSLNNKEIYYAGNSRVNYNFNSANPKMMVEYSPELDDGEYTLALTAKNSLGNKSDVITKQFVVSSSPKILNLYNYPNPFSNETYFTFKLTQIPDELKIKIFTVAGRLIKEFTRHSSDLNYDFNRIYWDGRDQDGDLVGNGVYLYKAIMTSAGKTQSLTQKLAVVR
ncbi:MAG: C25 family cysteine peptidase [Ignavibacteriaceae bacterium]